MKLDRVRLIQVAIPLRFPFETSFGRWTTRHALLVIAESEGRIGYGEVTAHEEPFYSYETLDTAREVIRSGKTFSGRVVCRQLRSAPNPVDQPVFFQPDQVAAQGCG